MSVKSKLAVQEVLNSNGVLQGYTVQFCDWVLTDDCVTVSYIPVECFQAIQDFIKGSVVN